MQQTRIVAADAPDAIALCANALRSGALLGMPTETVYGLAADADNASAVAAIFAAKGRPNDHPLIVHVAAFDGGMSGVAHYAEQVPPFARQLMAAFWPGPLTLILKRRPGVAAVAAGGQDSIGLRCPSHPLAQRLLNGLRHPAQVDALKEAPQDAPEVALEVALEVAPVWGLAAPSANRFGRISPTRASHVQEEFAESGLLILDGGECEVGIESTIIDCTRGAPVLLRPGTITQAQVQDACGRALMSPEALEEQGQQTPRASGTLASHYAPNAALRMMDAEALQKGLDLLAPALASRPAQSAQSAQSAVFPSLAVYARAPLRVPPVGVALRRMPSAAAVAAHELFSVLRELDALRVPLIWVETPPPGMEWDGVRDRLQRAAA